MGELYVQVKVGNLYTKPDEKHTSIPDGGIIDIIDTDDWAPGFTFGDQSKKAFTIFINPAIHLNRFFSLLTDFNISCF